MEAGVGHLDVELFQDVLLFGEVDHAHEVEPGEHFVAGDVVFDEDTNDVTLMHEVGDGLLEFLAEVLAEVGHDGFGEHSEEVQHVFLDIQQLLATAGDKGGLDL